MVILLSLFVYFLLNISFGFYIKCSFLAIIKDASDSFMSHVKSSTYCRRVVSLDNRFKYTRRANTQHKDTVSARRKHPKKSDDNSAVEDSCPPSVSTSLIWIQNDLGYDLWTPSNEKVDQILQGFYAHAHAHPSNSNAVISA